MPSQSKSKRVCVIGDSQMGSLRVADTNGLFEWPEEFEVEYWGANGPNFRQLKWSDGALHATGEALDSVRLINVAKRERIAVEDFDILVFYGCRLRMSSLFAAMLHWRYAQGSWPSWAVLTEAVQAHANACTAYRTAREFAKAGVEVVFIPSPLLTEGVVDPHGRKGALHDHPEAEHATPEDRAHLWFAQEEVATRDGIHFVRQPEDTIASAIFTKSEFACDGAYETGDNGHKSPEFAARVINDGLSALKGETAPSSVALPT